MLPLCTQAALDVALPVRLAAKHAILGESRRPKPQRFQRSNITYFENQGLRLKKHKETIDKLLLEKTW